MPESLYRRTTEEERQRAGHGNVACVLCGKLVVDVAWSKRSHAQKHESEGSVTIVPEQFVIRTPTTPATETQ